MSKKLNLAPNISHADDFYELLIAMHEGLDEAQSQAANAKLILILANHIGDIEVLSQAMQICRGQSVSDAQP